MIFIVRRLGLGLALGMSVLALIGCEQNPSAPSPIAAPSPFVAPAQVAPNAPPAHAQGMATSPHAAAPSAAAADPDGVSGTVVATMDAASYTYAQVDTGHGLAWVAGPQTKLAVGQKLGRMTGQVMTGFRSNTLSRTFDEIYFVSEYATGGAAPAMSPHTAPAAAPSAAPSDGAGAISGTVVATMDSGGYTYAQLDHGGTKLWVAGPQTKVAVGQKLGAMTGELMSGFHSGTLNRTFDEIYFITAFPTP